MKKLLCFITLALALASQSRADTALVFNEIMYHPATVETNFEWIEFHNQLAVDLDISHWRVSGEIDFKFPDNTRVPGRGFIVLAANPSALMAATGLTNVYGPVTNRLSNNGGTLRLRNNSDRVVSEVDYGVDGEWPVTPDGSGVSLAKRDRDFGSAQAANWTASAQIGGTPGADNFAAAPSLPLIISDAAWKFEASGADLGTLWRDRNYDDAAWSARNNLTNRAISGLFNTGVDANRIALADGAADPHYVLSYTAQGPVGANATVCLNHPAWAANDASSKWISVVNNGATTINGGGYGYRTTFSLDGFIPSSVRINFSVAIDNAMTNVFVNGTPTGFAFTGFAGFSSPFTLSSGFLSGVNTLEFGTENQGAGPGAFRAMLSGTGLMPNTNAPLPSGNSTYYFRKSFNFTNHLLTATLQLNPVVADGAVFYLNGVEVYRQNMPAGAISYSTPALSNVSPLAYTGPITIAASNLVAGNNVLAVEVHQAIGSADGPVLGTELIYSEVPAGATTLAFNELSGATNAAFWLELVNYGTNSIVLDGFVIQHDGTNDHEYVIPVGTTLNAGAFIAFTNATLGFTPLSGDKLMLFGPGKAAVYDGVVAKNGPRGRYPDGTGT
ncbi:MAG TPA: lamin tail domain-containing protein, partial [Methylomirabilota bacterium]|nr:lamin tail domain-containing protein [Methylomirabilota bacterium]